MSAVARPASVAQPSAPAAADVRLTTDLWMARRATSRRRRVVTTVLAVLLVLVAAASAGIGQFSIPISDVVGSVAAAWNRTVSDAGLGVFSLPFGAVPEQPNAEATLWLVRFPRVVLAIVVGAALAAGGAVMQGVFRNPLADPGVVGVSAGAAVGACLVIVLGLTMFGPFTVALFAFLGGLAATVVVYVTARAHGRTEVVTLVLTGIAVNAIGGAVIALCMFLGDTQQREQIVFWQLGSMNASRWVDVAVALPVVAVGMLVCALLAPKLDLLALGERQAQHLGVEVERLRIMAIVAVAVLTAGAVAFVGIIAFVGLVVPHVMRMVLGPAHGALLVTSALGGALLLLGADLLARTAVPYAELPIGMLTSLVGGPFFFWLLRRTRRTSGGWG